MPSYAIEVYRPGLTATDVRSIAASVQRAVAGIPELRFRGCLLAPGDEVCFVRLESEGRGAVDALVLELGLGDARVTELVDLPPE